MTVVRDMWSPGLGPDTCAGRAEQMVVMMRRTRPEKINFAIVVIEGEHEGGSDRAGGSRGRRVEGDGREAQDAD